MPDHGPVGDVFLGMPALPRPPVTGKDGQLAVFVPQLF
jgi:hypothetical protein